MNPLLSAISRYVRRGKLDQSRSRSGRRKASRATAKLRLELLEDRLAPAITTVAGTGTAGYSGDGGPAAA
jgi:hypothetical protein